tara:strand:+ start:547 stop:858 length:312 start_codon:yes stop_codon:yes gene_type:complete
MKKLVNGIEMDMTSQEIAQREADIQQYKDNELNFKLDFLRSIRNNFLIETDFYANSDVTMSDAMKTYRQALRDITNGLDTVAKVKTKLKIEDGNYINFPTKPI